MVTVNEIAIKLNVNKKAIYNQIFNHKIIKDKSIGGINYYGIVKEKIITSLIEDIQYYVKYYLLKTTETYYIYESKMNKL